ncbi:MAG: rod-binding protein [Rubripirellula sp.]
MDINSTGRSSSMPSLSPMSSMSDMISKSPELSMSGEASETKEAFTDFVGQTLFGSMLSSMRKTVGKPAYMHGGRTEEVFQQQLDQHIVEDLTKSSASSLADPMFELFNLQRRS